MQVLFKNPIFKLFLKEIEALGFTVSNSRRAGSLPYGVVGGRSNARWWLVPLTNRHVATSGLALFQPINSSAKFLKRTATALNSVGLASLWTRNKVYVSCPPVFSDLFDDKNLSYAFFTGTDSPHRKTAVQFMDQNGKIRGFAKLSQNPVVKKLLTHEAETLNLLRTLDLKSAIIPTVLFCGTIGGADALVTDTLKTVRTKSATTLNGAHFAFLRELAGKTAVPGTDGTGWVVADLRRRYETVAERLPVDWRRRLEKAFEVVALHGEDWGPKSLSHGDFTPWNTFFVDDRLYVFDWEYAHQSYSPGYDLIHFMFSLPERKRQPVDETIGQIRKTLRETKYAGDDTFADILFLCYLCGHSLHYIAREPELAGKVILWDGEQETATFIDTIIEEKN